MARRANEIRLHKAERIVRNQPGESSGYYARLMGCHREAFSRMLVQLEDRGILFCEDAKGKLWPYNSKGD